MSAFGPETIAKFDALVKRYPQKRAALLPMLHLAQGLNSEGKLTPEAEKGVADYLGLPVSRVREVASFYTMYSDQPRGRHHLLVCRTLSCALNGCPDNLAALEKELGVKEGEVTPDGAFSFEAVECLGACYLGCVIQAGEELHGHMTPEKVKSLVAELKGRK
jgi:NADH-quinone oxidoreductase subunit E